MAFVAKTLIESSREDCRSIVTSVIIESGGLLAAEQGTVPMSVTKDGSISPMQHRINAEIQDNLDEDLELELEDSELAELADLLACWRTGMNCPKKKGLSRGACISRSSCACSAS